MDEFQACLDRSSSLPWPVIRGIVEADLGRPLSEVFSSVDERPLASASIAQVHAAVLRDSGKEVVIKVVRPGTQDIITADLNAVRCATGRAGAAWRPAWLLAPALVPQTVWLVGACWQAGSL